MLTYEEALQYIHSVTWQGSRPGLSRITELCRLLGGGGHERAAGATIKADSPEKARKTVLDAVLGALKG